MKLELESGEYQPRISSEECENSCWLYGEKTIKKSRVDDHVYSLKETYGNGTAQKGSSGRFRVTVNDGHITIVSEFSPKCTLWYGLLMCKSNKMANALGNDRGEDEFETIPVSCDVEDDANEQCLLLRNVEDKEYVSFMQFVHLSIGDKDIKQATKFVFKLIS